MQYKVCTYRNTGELEEALNTMAASGYEPAFINRSSGGNITVTYKQ